MSPLARRCLLATLTVAGLGAGLQLYSVLPAEFEVPPLELDPDARHLILLFHGSNGSNEPLITMLEARVRELAGAQAGTQARTAVARYIWAPFSDARLRTHPNGTLVGESLGLGIANLAQLESLHLIAHSAGAYVLEPLCESYRAATAHRNGHSARIRMTFLDPIGFRGPLDPGWGARHFGQCADEAEAFINTDDPAPATARVLRHARTTDVTSDPARQQFSQGGHRWPVQYYINSLSATGSTIARMPDSNGASRDR